MGLISGFINLAIYNLICQFNSGMVEQARFTAVNILIHTNQTHYRDDFCLITWQEQEIATLKDTILLQLKSDKWKNT